MVRKRRRRFSELARVESDFVLVRINQALSSSRLACVALKVEVSVNILLTPSQVSILRLQFHLAHLGFGPERLRGLRIQTR